MPKSFPKRFRNRCTLQRYFWYIYALIFWHEPLINPNLILVLICIKSKQTCIILWPVLDIEFFARFYDIFEFKYFGNHYKVFVLLGIEKTIIYSKLFFNKLELWHIFLFSNE